LRLGSAFAKSPIAIAADGLNSSTPRHAIRRYPRGVPNRLTVPSRLARRPSRPRRPGVRVIVVGDLTLDVVLSPAAALASGTDVPGRVRLRQGGSAATAARWFGRLGAQVQLICAVGRDGPGRALVEAVRSDDVVVRASRIAGHPTGRIGVLVSADGERSFVADRGAADHLAPADLRAAWFRAAEVVHLPFYSLLGEPLGSAGREAIRLAHEAGAAVSLDLASVGPLLANGRPAALALVRTMAPDVLLATAGELSALLDSPNRAVLGARALAIAPIVIVKRGGNGATVHLRDQSGVSITFDVATKPLTAGDTTGAGDAFDAGFLIGFAEGRRTGRSTPAGLRRAVLAGHRAAARQLSGSRPELDLR
jgi:sugar/nucleoside kinase (ribokinase family)